LRFAWPPFRQIWSLCPEIHFMCERTVAHYETRCG
jgi:hypothetical protein